MGELLLQYLILLKQGELTYEGALELSNLLWIYHRTAAKTQKIDTTRGGWFMQLVDKNEHAEYQRGAVDIVKEWLSVYPAADKSVTLSSLYMTEIERLISLLSVYINK